MLLPNPFHWRRTQFSALQVLWFGRSGRWLSRIFHVYRSHLDFTIPKWVMNSFLGEAAVEKMLSVDLIILDTLRSTAPPTILLWLSIGDFSTKRKQVFDPELLILVLCSTTAHYGKSQFFVYKNIEKKKISFVWTKAWNTWIFTPKIPIISIWILVFWVKISIFRQKTSFRQNWTSVEIFQFSRQKVHQFQLDFLQFWGKISFLWQN